MKKTKLAIGGMDGNRIRAVSRRRTLSAKPSVAEPVDAVLRFPNMGGNQAVQQWVKSGALQAKMSIGPANDIYEQEADQVADEVMRMPEPGVVDHSAPTDEVRRKPGWPFAQGPSCGDEEAAVQAKFESAGDSPLIRMSAEEEEEMRRQPEKEEEELRKQPEEEEEKLQRQPEKEEEEKIQTKGETDQEWAAPENVENRVRSSGGGQALPESARSFFEPRFDHDFSQVRVHADSDSAQMAKSIQAQAFTHGQDIYFSAGKYNPDESSGKQLLAHELTHVIQQKDGEKT